MTDKRFKKVNYKRELKTSGQVKELLQDIINIIRYYQDKTKLQKGFIYKMKNSYNRFRATQYIQELKNDFKLWWDIYKFKKWITEKKGVQNEAISGS